MRMEAVKEGVHSYLQKCNARHHPFSRFLASSLEFSKNDFQVCHSYLHTISAHASKSRILT
jgi:hypothetical protein